MPQVRLLKREPILIILLRDWSADNFWTVARDVTHGKERHDGER
jgi:hypothetical protein